MKAAIRSIKGTINGGLRYFAVDVWPDDIPDCIDRPVTLVLSEADYFRLTGYDDRNKTEPSKFFQSIADKLNSN